MNKTGDFLKGTRELKGLTLKELSDKSGVGSSTISDIENGKAKHPRTDTLQKLAQALDVPINNFFAEIPNSNNRLTTKDKKSIHKDLKNVMDEFKDGTDGTKYYNGEEINDEDFDLIETAIEIALTKIKIKNKEKYTPNKYKNKK